MSSKKGTQRSLGGDSSKRRSCRVTALSASSSEMMVKIASAKKTNDCAHAKALWRPVFGW
jgi:hypothetical protein